MITGDCYEAAVNGIRGQFSEYPNIRLVQGECLGVGGNAKGLLYGHAWLEFTANGQEYCIEVANGEPFCIPKDKYYEMGSIGENVYTYSPQQVTAKLIEHETYGCWDLITESGK